MKTRWMKSVIKHSQEPRPALPYQRGQRRPLRKSAAAPLARCAKSA